MMTIMATTTTTTIMMQGKKHNTKNRNHESCRNNRLTVAKLHRSIEGGGINS